MMVMAWMGARRAWNFRDHMAQRKFWVRDLSRHHGCRTVGGTGIHGTVSRIMRTNVTALASRGMGTRGVKAFTGVRHGSFTGDTNEPKR